MIINDYYQIKKRGGLLHMTFHKKLQKLRKANGLSQEQLAEKLNVSRQAVSKWETGSVPDMDNVIKISRFFDCTLDYLLNNEAGEVRVNTKPLPDTPRPVTARQNSYFSLITGSIVAGAGAAGLFIICILSSVYPAVIYDPPEGEVRTIMETGFGAFLKYHHISWLFILCCVFFVCGILIILSGIYRKRKT